MTQEEIFNQYYKKVENMIYGKVSDRYLAEDLTSQTFLKVYQKLDSFDDKKASISTWIYTIANNTVIDYFRTRKVSEEVPEDIACESLIEDEVINEEILIKLKDALLKLAKRERDILIFRFYDNMTLKDIAVKMGMSYANAKVVQAKALNKMKELIDIDDYPF